MIFVLTGVITGVVAFSLQLLKEFLSDLKLDLAYSLYSDHMIVFSGSMYYF